MGLLIALAGAALAGCAAQSPVQPPEAHMRWQDCEAVDAMLAQRSVTEALAGQGNACAQYALGFAYHHGLAGLVRDDAQAAAWYSMAGDAGHAGAHNNLGLLYLEGHGVRRDLAEALRQFQSAERGGETAALVNLGLIYAAPDPALHDDARALDAFRRAAEAGLGNGEYNLGLMYRAGQGVARDDSVARAWFEKAAAHDVAGAQVALGEYFEQGSAGLPVDLRQASAWYRKAAQQGAAEAQHHLALMIRNGSADSPGPAEALDWLAAAAEQDYGPAQHELAEMYFTGSGAPRNDFLGYFWQRLFVGGSVDKAGPARQRLDQMGRRLSSADIDRALDKIVGYMRARYGSPPSQRADPVGAPELERLKRWSDRNQQYLADNARRSGVRVTASGLQYEAIRAGQGSVPGASDHPSLRYRLTLIDGELVDSSTARGGSVTVGMDRIVVGLAEGLTLMKAGGRARIVVPPVLGYGDRGAGQRIPPASTLVFDVEVIAP